MAKVFDRSQSKCGKEGRCRGIQGSVGHSAGVWKANFDENWIRQGAERGAAQQNDSYPENEAGYCT